MVKRVVLLVTLVSLETSAVRFVYYSTEGYQCLSFPVFLLLDLSLYCV